MQTTPGKKLPILSLVLLLFAGTASAATWTVNATGANFTSIQAAIGNATAGDTILVYGGTYNGQVTVNKALNLTGTSGAGMPVINGSGSGTVVTVSADGATLDGFVVQNGNTGVSISSSNNIIENNIIQDNRGTSGDGGSGYGLYVAGGSNNNAITNNTMQHIIGGTGSVNTWYYYGRGGPGGSAYGIYLDTSSNSTIAYNTIQGNNGGDGGDGGSGVWGGSGGSSYGIYLNASYSNTVHYNIFQNSSGGMSGTTNRNFAGPGGAVYGIYLSSSSNNNFTNNTVQYNNGGVPAYVGDGGHSYGVYLYTSSNNIFAGNALQNNTGGSESWVYGVGGSGYGILSSYSVNNTIEYNTVAKNTGRLGPGSPGNGYGILLSYSNDSTIKSNIIESNEGVAGTAYGLYIDSSNGSLIYDNYVNDTNPVGVISSANSFNITKTAGTSIINSSYVGGNFWAKPDGMGFSQTCRDADRDNICDTAYGIDGNNIDYLPLTLISDETPPAGVSGLGKISDSAVYIEWTWTDPPDPDFAYVTVYIDGAFRENVSKGVQYYRIDGLEPGTNHTISTRTVDLAGNINGTWVNQTSSTLAKPLLVGGTIVAFGRNYNGQLGDGTANSRNYPADVLGVGNVTAVDTAYENVFAIRNDGTVWAWGANGNGGLGLNYSDYIPHPVPAQVTAQDGVGYLYGITAVTARRRGAFALASDGTVWAWGSNYAGPVGDNTTTDRYAPVRVLGPGGIGYLSNITAVAGGGNGYAALALKDDGTVWAWGPNYYGQLGDNTTSNSLIPVQVLGPDGIAYLSNITAIDTSGYHSIALKDDGTVWAWGQNYYGQLGNASVCVGWGCYSATPVQVQGPGGMGYLSNITAIAAGYNHNLALRSDGTVWAWGQNYYGQLGDNTTADSPVPVGVTGLDGAGYITNITAIAAGTSHSVAVRDDGTLWAWGQNYYGQLGDGTNTDRYAPVQVLWLKNVSAVVAGSGYTVALIGPVPQSMFKAMLSVSPSAKTTAPSTNESFTLSLTNTQSLPDNFTLSCTGSCAFSENPVAVNAHQRKFITATITSQASGTANYTISAASQANNNTVVASASVSMTVIGGGSVWAWGIGPLGSATVGSSMTPFRLDSIYDVVAIATGYDDDWHNLALKSDGTVWAWGSNYDGQLGNASICVGPGCSSPTPILVDNLSNVTKIAAGADLSLALRNDGTVWAWGRNTYGELGNASVCVGCYSATPVQVDGLSDVVAIAGGYDHALAVESDGTVWAWGSNVNRQLGNTGIPAANCWATGVNMCLSSMPVQVNGPGGPGYLADAVAVAAGNTHSLALESDGTVWAWGQNFFGQLGNASIPIWGGYSATPVQVDGLYGAIAITSGSTHSAALRYDGTVLSWGYNSDGQLGNSSVPSGCWDASCTSALPIRADGLSNATSISAQGPQGYTTIALKADGTVWAWGANWGGNLGDGTTSDRSTPVQVLGGNGSGYLSNMAGVAAGSHYTFALAGPLPTPSFQNLTDFTIDTDRDDTISALGGSVGSGMRAIHKIEEGRRYSRLSIAYSSIGIRFAAPSFPNGSRLEVRGASVAFPPSSLGLAALSKAINVTPSFNFTDYTVTFRGAAGERAFKCPSNCGVPSSWSELAAEDVPGGMRVTLGPGDPIILIGLSAVEEPTTVAAPEADFLLVALIFALAAFAFAFRKG